MYEIAEIARRVSPCERGACRLRHRRGWRDLEQRCDQDRRRPTRVRSRDLEWHPDIERRQVRRSANGFGGRLHAPGLQPGRCRQRRTRSAKGRTERPAVRRRHEGARRGRAVQLERRARRDPHHQPGPPGPDQPGQHEPVPDQGRLHPPVPQRTCGRRLQGSRPTVPQGLAPHRNKQLFPGRHHR